MDSDSYEAVHFFDFQTWVFEIFFYFLYVLKADSIASPKPQLKSNYGCLKPSPMLTNLSRMIGLG